MINENLEPIFKESTGEKEIKPELKGKKPMSGR